MPPPGAAGAPTLAQASVGWDYLGSPGQSPTTPGAAHSRVRSSFSVAFLPAGMRSTPLRSRMGPVKGSKLGLGPDMSFRRAMIRS